MAKKYYHEGVLVSIEPPFTPEEEAEIYARMAAGPVTIYRGLAPPDNQPPQPRKSPDPQEAQ